MRGKFAYVSGNAQKICVMLVFFSEFYISTIGDFGFLVRFYRSPAVILTTGAKVTFHKDPPLD